MEPTISADEIALYDRQIRLWGVKAQEKIRNANILLLTIKALGNEIAKNLVLAGIGSITIVDNAVVTEEDLGSQFFISEADIGKPRAEAAKASIQRLNPRVTVNVSSGDILTVDPSFFSQFTLTIAVDLPISSLTLINAACRLSKKPFYCAGSHGVYGFMFADLIEHIYAISRDRSNREVIPNTAETATRTVLSVAQKRENGKDVELITKREIYQPLILTNSAPLAPEYLNSARRLRSVTPLLPCMRALWEFETRSNGRPPSHSEQDLKLFTTFATEKSRELLLPTETLKSEFLRRFLQNLYAELPPTCAVLGGMLAQDVINVLGGKEQPCQNMLLFDGEESKAPIYALYPIVPTQDASL